MKILLNGLNIYRISFLNDYKVKLLIGICSKIPYNLSTKSFFFIMIKLHHCLMQPHNKTIHSIIYDTVLSFDFQHS